MFKTATEIIGAFELDAIPNPTIDEMEILIREIYRLEASLAKTESMWREAKHEMNADGKPEVHIALDLS